MLPHRSGSVAVLELPRNRQRRLRAVLPATAGCREDAPHPRWAGGNLPALAAVGRLTQGIALIEETIRSVETNGDLCYMPELLRVKAGVALPKSAGKVLVRAPAAV
jgi:hypothetical protein